MGATDTFGFPFPDEADLVMDGSQAIEDLADDLDAKLGNEPLECEAIAYGALDSGGGWVLTSFSMRRAGLLVHIQGVVEREVNELTVTGADGNLNNVPVLRIHPLGGDSVPLPATNVGIASGGTGRVCSWILDTNGDVNLAATTPGSDIADGEFVSFNGVYLAADYTTSD